MVRVVDATKACCYDTLATPIREAVRTFETGETFEVMINANMKKDFETFVGKEAYQVLGERSEGDVTIYTVKSPANEVAEESRMENCMVCGSSLEYLTEAVAVGCNYCQKEASAYIRCPKGHYVCDVCHEKGAYEAIKDFALTAVSKDPIAIGEVMMAHPSVPMLGCENAWIVAAALMAALRNTGKLKIEDKQVLEAIERTKDQALSGYCGLTGACGIPIAVGAVFSVLLGAECPKDRETAITMRAVARTLDAVANDTGPCCCKSYVRTALGLSHSLVKEYFDTSLPIHREKISCLYVRRHPHGCRASRCLYLHIAS